ncbi:unnamed protein product [Adineta ricciae]|uniref:Uncharacterized protein n=1 Tax=Adineta ricciae TaxID=249248 RepID=A0A816GGC5_ADIRI|nr:unnamed protein product [Adineta ricciae]
MMQKRHEAFRKTAELEIIKDQRSDLEDKRNQSAAQSEKIQANIAENAKVLEENQRSAAIMKSNLEKQEKAKQMAEHRAKQTKGQFEHTRSQIKQLSDNIAKKEKDFTKLNDIHQQMSIEIEQRKTKQETLKRQTQDLHDQWTAKEIFAATLTTEVNNLQNEITNRRTQRREEHEQKRQRDEHRQTQSYYQRNYNKN